MEIDEKLQYTGEFASNTMTGNGTMTFPQSGLRYEGHFLDDQLSGTGTLLFEDGKRIDGNWLGNSLVEGVFVDAQGQKVMETIDEI